MKYSQVVRAGLLVWLVGLLGACSGETAQNDGFKLSGSVGDGSLVGATISLADPDGEVVFEALSDEATRYEADIPPETALPLLLTAKGGIDLVSGGANAFDLTAVADSSSETVNVSPLTTLATRMAECSGEISEASMANSWSRIEAELGMGLGEGVNPMTHPLSTGNAAELVLANEALREALRRTLAALVGSGADLTADELLVQIACDLQSDGRLNGSGQGADARTAATFQAAQAGVLLEVIAGTLYVDGQNATAAMDLAIEAILGAPGVSVRDFVVTDALVAQARAALAVFLVQLPDDELFDLMLLLAGTHPAAVAADVSAALDAVHQTALWGMPDRIALADSSEIAALGNRMSQQDGATAPMISLAASATTVDNGSSTTLSWASAQADRCTASGGWEGIVGLDGAFTTPPLTHTTDFALACIGLGGTSSATVQVVVTNPDPAPVTTLTAQNTTVAAGSATMLSWTSSNADECQAGGAWTGTKPTSGSTSTGALTSSQTYTLTCSGTGGSDTASVTIAVDAPSAPAEPTVSLSATSQQVDDGGSTTLSWSSSNVTSCAASGGWTGTKPTGGSQLVGPLSASTTFTLTCSGAGGTASASTTVQVNAAAPPPPQPVVALSAAAVQVNSGDSTTLSWSSTDATSCTASGGWSGSKATSGNQLVGPLSASTTFTLTCSGGGGSASASTAVQVNAAPAPTVSLSAATTQVNSGDSTTLSWSSTNATSCTASGGWSGGKATSGNQLVGPLSANTTFSLTCSGSGGNAVAMITVNVMGTLNLSWVAPTQNVDGSALTDLAGYKIYYGDTSRNYGTPVAVNSATATSFSITLPSGSYYVAMTALDQDGNESAYSNEVLKATQ